MPSSTSLTLAPDGGVQARFIGAIRLDLDTPEQVEASKQRGVHYEKEFRIVPGRWCRPVRARFGNRSRHSYFEVYGADASAARIPVRIPDGKTSEKSIRGFASFLCRARAASLRWFHGVRHCS